MINPDSTPDQKQQAQSQLKALSSPSTQVNVGGDAKAPPQDVREGFNTIGNLLTATGELLETFQPGGTRLSLGTKTLTQLAAKYGSRTASKIESMQKEK